MNDLVIFHCNYNLALHNVTKNVIKTQQWQHLRFLSYLKYRRNFLERKQETIVFDVIVCSELFKYCYSITVH